MSNKQKTFGSRRVQLKITKLLTVSIRYPSILNSSLLILVSYSQNQFQIQKQISFSMKRSLQMLNQKDLTIQNLQAQLSQSTHTPEEISFIQTQLQNLQHRYSLLQNQHLNSKCMIQSKVEASDKTISNLKSQIIMLETQMKEKQMILSDHQHQTTSLKDQKIARDNQAEMLRYQAQGFKSDSEALIYELGKLNNTRSIYDSQLKEIQGDLVQLQQTKLSISQKISNTERQKQSLKIESQRLVTIINNYENQNIGLNEQLRELEEEQKNASSETSSIRQKLMSEELLQTQLQNRLAKARNQMEQTQGQIREQKDRSKEIMALIRNKSMLRDSLQTNIQSQLKEKNFLIGKNAQIAEINEKLKDDLTFCQSHLNNLKSSVQAQKQLLQRLNREDQKIVEIIQNRQWLKQSKSQNKLNISRTTGFNY